MASRQFPVVTATVRLDLNEAFRYDEQDLERGLFQLEEESKESESQKCLRFDLEQSCI